MYIVGKSVMDQLGKRGQVLVFIATSSIYNLIQKREGLINDLWNSKHQIILTLKLQEEFMSRTGG